MESVIHGVPAGQPRVSLILPTYNSAKYVGEALESVFRQTYDSYEVIVIDDGSTDETRQVLEPYRLYIRYLYQRNAGPSAARNAGLGLARGKYVVFMDADDVLLPTKLAEQAAWLDAQPNVGCLHSGWYMIDPEGAVIAAREPWRHASRLNLETWLTQGCFCLGAMMFRCHWLVRVGGFDPTRRQAEDVDLLLRMSLMGCRMAWLCRPTLGYREHPRSATRDVIQRAAGVNRVMADFFARRDLPDGIRRLESAVRFSSLMWCVGILYPAGCVPEIPAYLRESLAHTPDPLERTVQRWLGHLLVNTAAQQGYDLEGLRAVWPCFREAIQVDEDRWRQIERRLDWLLRVELQIRSTRSERVGPG